MYEHNALGFWSGLALCLTKVRSSRARCPATALILKVGNSVYYNYLSVNGTRVKHGTTYPTDYL